MKVKLKESNEYYGLKAGTVGTIQSYIAIDKICCAVLVIKDKFYTIRIDNLELFKEKSSKSFIPPSLDEVKEYCKEKNSTINPEAFWAYYTANGWMRGKTKIKSWKMAIVTWEQNEKKTNNDEKEFQRKWL